MKKLAKWVLIGLIPGAGVALLTLHIIQRAVVGDWPFARRS